MVEIQWNENAVGASRERLMSESLSRLFCSYGRFIRC